MKTRSRTQSATSVAKYERLWAEIQRVSHEALAKATPPTPMIVGSPTTPLGNDIDYTKKTWFVADGVCGFAWVVLESGRTGFAQWLLKKGYGHKEYQWGGGYKGVSFWCSGAGFPETRQSLELKQQVCRAVARYLNEQGIPAYSNSRID